MAVPPRDRGPSPRRRTAWLLATAMALATLVLGAIAFTGAPPAGAADPAPSADAAIVVEATTGRTVFAREAGEPRAIASATKIMTALVARDLARLDKVIVVPGYNGDPAESVAGLRKGERMTVADLLRALLLESGNDAAVALAVGTAGSRRSFVERMNAKARALGLRETSFANPIGLDEAGNFSSASDLARMGRELRRDRFLRRTVARSSIRLRTGGEPRVMENRNGLVGAVKWVNGIKTGYTEEAGYVLVGSGTRRGVTMVSVVLGEPSDAARERDTRELLEYGLARWRLATPVKRGAALEQAAVRWQPDETATLVAARNVRRPIPRGTRLRVVTRGPRELTGPLPAGRRVGTVEVRQGRRVVARVPLITAAAVPEATTLERIEAFLPVPFALLVAALAVVGTLLVGMGLLRRRRRGSRSRATAQNA